MYSSSSRGNKSGVVIGSYLLDPEMMRNKEFTVFREEFNTWLRDKREAPKRDAEGTQPSSSSSSSSSSSKTDKDVATEVKSKEREFIDEIERICVTHKNELDKVKAESKTQEELKDAIKKLEEKKTRDLEGSRDKFIIELSDFAENLCEQEVRAITYTTIDNNKVTFNEILGESKLFDLLGAFSERASAKEYLKDKLENVRKIDIDSMTKELSMAAQEALKVKTYMMREIEIQVSSVVNKIDSEISAEKKPINLYNCLVMILTSACMAIVGCFVVNRLRPNTVDQDAVGIVVASITLLTFLGAFNEASKALPKFDTDTFCQTAFNTLPDKLANIAFGGYGNIGISDSIITKVNKVLFKGLYQIR